MSYFREPRCGSNEEDVKVSMDVNDDNGTIDRLVQTDSAHLPTSDRRLNIWSPLVTSPQDPYDSLSHCTKARKSLTGSISSLGHLRNNSSTSTKYESITIPSDQSPSEMEVDSDSEPLWSPSMPVYIEGSIRTFPRSLYKLIKKAEEDKENHMKDRFLTRVWASSGPRRGTIYGEGEDGVTKWIIRGSGEEVDLGRFRYGTDYQLIVAQHPKFNQGKVSLICCRGSFGKERNDPKFYKIKSSRWLACDSLPGAKDESEIERIISFSRKRKIDVSSMSHRATQTSNPKVSEAASEASRGGEEIEMPIDSQQTKLRTDLKVPRRMKIDRSFGTKVASSSMSMPSIFGSNHVTVTDNCKEPTTSITDLPPQLSSRSELLRAQGISSESRLDIGSGKSQILPCRASKLESTAMKNLKALKTLATSQSNTPSHIVSGGTKKRDTRSSPEGNFTEKITSVEQTKQAEPTLVSSTRLNNPSIAKSNTTVQADVVFIFKETQNGPELRRRPYALCKTVQMLYSQALAAGIAQSDTAMLSVQIQGQETRMVPRGDHLDYEEVKKAIRDAEQDAKDPVLGGVDDIEVLVFNYEWE